MIGVTIEDSIDALEYLISEDCTAVAVDYTCEIEKAIEVLKTRQSLKPGRDNYFFTCPVCKKAVYREQKYCDGCGQAIDWEEE